MTPMDHMSHDRSYDSVPSTSGAVGAGREGEWWGGKVSGGVGWEGKVSGGVGREGEWWGGKGR